MKSKLLGVRRVQGVAKDTGKPYGYVELHTSYSVSRVSGEAVDKFRVYDNSGFDVVQNVRPGMMIDVDRDSDGNLIGLEICK